MAENQLAAAGKAAGSALPHQDYTMALLRNAALCGSIPSDKLEELRSGLHAAAAERAAAYTRGRSGTVTRKQAEAFYASVFCQLDAVLLEMHNDAAAEEALRSQPLTVLLEAGQIRSLQLYEEAKEHFRRAYLMTRPYHTSLYRSLLKDFEWFCTKYDARFRAAETKVQYSYPLLSDARITENGVIGVHRYYTSLLYEAELLKAFPQDEMQQMMQRYAEKYLTQPDMIAENLAELALRHALTAALTGAEKLTVNVTAEQVEEAESAYSTCGEMQLCSDMQRAAERLLPAACAENNYIVNALPSIAKSMQIRINNARMNGWLAVADS